VEDVSFAIRAGESVAILGKNGAGKTTMVRLLVALLHPTRGRVMVGGVSTSGRAPEDLARQVAYVGQDPDRQLFARTVLEEVTFAPRHLGAASGEARDRARDAMARVGLTAREAVHPYDLAPSERRLVAIAAALAQGAPVLILDEPTRGMDPAWSARVGDVIHQCAAAGKTIVLVTHDLQFMVECCDRALVLAGGRVAADLGADAAVRDLAWANALGLRVAAAAALGEALALPGRPVRTADVIAGLAARRRGVTPA
jgi:energy-coupling factor transporter ATP-binding protein EcfA2